MKKTCPRCGDEFNGRKTQTFCSRSCAKFKDLPTKICERCGEEFRKNPEYSYAVWSSIRFCSRICRGSGKPPRRADCELCGSTFQVRTYNGKDARFCSHDCYAETLRVITYPLKHRASGEFSNPMRRVIYERDGGQCCQCGTTDNLEFDHIVPMFLGGIGTVENGQLLCRPCHLQKTLRERPRRVTSDTTSHYDHK